MNFPPSPFDWNAFRFDPRARRGHVESYFFKLNDAEGRRALWLKATVLSDGRGSEGAVAEAWGIAFDREGGHVAVKQTVPYAQARFSTTGLDIEVGGLRFRDGSIQGEIEQAGRRIAVDLSFTKGSPPLIPFPENALYFSRLPRSKLVSPFPDSRFTGSYTVDGETIRVDGARGMQGHNWGENHAHLYAWAHCNQWDQDEDFVFEGVSARVKLGPVLTPLATLVCVRHRGVRYEFNRVRDILKNRGEVSHRRWTFRAESDLGRIEGELFGQTHDFVGLRYPNPDGAMTYCLNTKLAYARLRFEPFGRLPMTLTSRTAALEVGTREPNHGIRMYV